MQLGPAEILVILVVALLVFGPNRLPELARQVGRGMREFRQFQQNLRSELEGTFTEDASDQSSPPPTLPPKMPDPTDRGSAAPGMFPTADAPAAGQQPTVEPKDRSTPPGSPPD